MLHDVVTNCSPERIWGENRAWKGKEMKLKSNFLDLLCYFSPVQLIRVVQVVKVVKVVQPGGQGGQCGPGGPGGHACTQTDRGK